MNVNKYELSLNLTNNDIMTCLVVLSFPIFIYFHKQMIIQL